MELFSTPTETPPKCRRGRPKGSKNKNPYPITDAVRKAAKDKMMARTPEERSTIARRAALTGSSEERSARASRAAKSLWTPQYREKASKYQKEMGIVPPSRKGKTNKNPYPYTEAVLRRMSAKIHMPYQGKFRPNNPQKYDGDPTNIVYRSSYELRFMSYLDSNPNVLKWQSEELCIPYFDPSTNRMRRYFPDFLVVVKHGEGTLTQLIEIKPSKECVPPKIPAKKTRRFIREVMTYGTNQAKWSHAEEYCKDRNWKFKIITEKDLGIKY